MYISDKQLGERYAVTRQTIWRWLKACPDFPAPYSLSSGCTRWKLAEIESWEAAREQADRAA